MTKLSTTSGIERLSVAWRGNGLSMQRWDLLELDAPDGTRDPIVLHSDAGARAVLIVLQPGQARGDHQGKENAWVGDAEGEVEIPGGGETVAAGPGTMFRFDADERHAIGSP